MAQEALIPQNARSLRIELIGASGLTFLLQMGGDDFADNREKPAEVVAKSRGIVQAMIDGENPDARTGSMSVPFISENNGLATAFLDVINGRQAWANESTGKVGFPYIQRYAVTMKVTLIGASEIGGDMVTTYEKVIFKEKLGVATDLTKISVDWLCYGTVTGTGPT